MGSRSSKEAASGKGGVEDRRGGRQVEERRVGGQVTQHLVDRDEDFGFCSERDKRQQRLLGRDASWLLAAPLPSKPCSPVTAE